MRNFRLLAFIAILMLASCIEQPTQPIPEPDIVPKSEAPFETIDQMAKETFEALMEARDISQKPPMDNMVIRSASEDVLDDYWLRWDYTVQNGHIIDYTEYPQIVGDTIKFYETISLNYTHTNRLWYAVIDGEWCIAFYMLDYEYIYFQKSHGQIFIMQKKNEKPEFRAYFEDPHSYHYSANGFPLEAYLFDEEWNVINSSEMKYQWFVNGVYVSDAEALIPYSYNIPDGQYDFIPDCNVEDVYIELEITLNGNIYKNSKCSNIRWTVDDRVPVCPIGWNPTDENEFCDGDFDWNN